MIYARPPRVETTHPGYSTTTLQLINLLPETVNVPPAADLPKGPEVPPTPTPGPATSLPQTEVRARLDRAEFYYAPSGLVLLRGEVQGARRSL